MTILQAFMLGWASSLLTVTIGCLIGRNLTIGKPLLRIPLPGKGKIKVTGGEENGEKKKPSAFSRM